VVLTSGLEVVLFNLPAGDWAAGERGIACHPRRIAEFQDGVGLAIDHTRSCWAAAPELPGRHRAGRGRSEKARETLVENLRFAAAVTRRAGHRTAAGTAQYARHARLPGRHQRAGLDMIDAVGSDNLRLQYDIYHAQVMEGDLARTLQENLPRIGHVQLADNPGRHEPGTARSIFPSCCGISIASAMRMGRLRIQARARTEDSLAGWGAAGR
jgi:hydroxypyruvate isomerase